MRVPIRWLNDYVKVDDIAVEELANLFLGIGFEVEEITNPADNYKNIVTGQILELEKHPNADSLTILTISIGKAHPITIVTGAKNVAKGDIVPVALDGAVVSGGKEIHSSELRGILSEGMLCSGKELDIDDNTIEGAEVNGILILPKNTEIGQEIAKALDIDEYIFDVSINSNRPDCNSILGLAKEIAVKLNRKVKLPSLDVQYKSRQNGIRIPKIKIDDLNECSRYFGNVVTDIRVEKSPIWMRRRLIAAGHRPINNIVDVTNYVLVEVGQPLHAFDYDKVDGDIHVRSANKGEKLIALNDTEYSLQANTLVIADDKKGLAIAGVMGGEYSSITNKTTTVFLEAARFSKKSIRTTSRALGLRSDCSARYERGVDYESVDMGRLRALNLYEDLGAGCVVNALTFMQQEMAEKRIIKTSFSQINRLLGITISGEEIKRILTTLDFDIVESKGEEFTCLVPLHRDDVDNFSDLAEEVIRFYGYEKIESTNMESASLTSGEIPLTILGARKLRNVLCGSGMYEIINFSFIGESDCEKLGMKEEGKRQIRIINPLGEDRAYMRTQLVSSMIRTLQLNKSRQNDNFALFELAKVFKAEELPLKKLPSEPYTLCVGMSGEKYDFYYLKSIISTLFTAFSLKLEVAVGTKSWLHPGISADIILDGRVIGSFGKIHPKAARNFETSEDIYLLEMDVEDMISRPLNLPKVTLLPKYPCVDRDLAVVVRKDVTAGEIIAIIKEASSGYLEDAKLFDVYQGGQIEEGYKSMAFSVRFRSLEKTLLDTETQSLMSAIMSALEQNFDAKLR